MKASDVESRARSTATNRWMGKTMLLRGANPNYKADLSGKLIAMATIASPGLLHSNFFQLLVA